MFEEWYIVLCMILYVLYKFSMLIVKVFVFNLYRHLLYIWQTYIVLSVRYKPFFFY